MLLIAFSVCLSILLIGVISNYLLLEKTTSSTLDHLEAIASVQENRIEEATKRNFERLDSVTSRTQLRLSLSSYLQDNQESHLEKIESILSDALYSTSDFRAITLYSVDGDALVSVHKDDFPVDQVAPFIPEAQFRNILLMDTKTSPLIFHLSGALILDNKTMGLITIESNPNTITSITSDYSGLGETGETILAKRTPEGDANFINPLRFDPTGYFSRIISQESIEVPITQALLQNENRFKEMIDYRGEKVLAVTRYLETNDWGLVTKVDASEIYAPFYEIQITQIGFVIIISGVLTSISLLISDQLLKPLAKLKKLVVESKRGNYNTKFRFSGNNEITSLAKSFVELQSKLEENRRLNKTQKKSLQEKLQATINLRNAIYNSAIVAITDNSGKIIFVNKKFEEISKYSRNSLIGQTHRILKSGMHGENFYKNLWETISSGRSWTGDFKNRAKDGSYFWVRTTITPFVDRKGNVKHYFSISYDITELINQKDTISSHYQELLEIETKKEEFTSMISHELKTPVTPIRFNSEMLSEPGLLGDLNEDQKNAVSEIEINASRLERLISDMLYAHKLDMNKMIFNKKIFSSRHLEERLEKSITPLFQTKKVQFTIKNNMSKDLFSDEDRILQVLENLVKNSIDFVPETNGKITVKINEVSDGVEFFVEDNGIGIPKSKQKDLFKKFYQVDTSHTRYHGGTGLGLVICKGFVEGLGGKIWVESEEGKGSTFCFRIPNKKQIEVNTYA